jgi:glucose-6-phosphate dehydrogenase assembly protein OpcA
VKLPLAEVEREITKLWEAEALRSGSPRIELMTLVALVSDPALVDRALHVVSDCVRVHPSRTIVVTWRDGPLAELVADVKLHRADPGGAVYGDAITLEAVAGARDWLPDNLERLALADLPVCIWWVGDLPDFDRLFDRTLSAADLVVVSSAEMDLRDLEKLSDVVRLSRGRYALTDLTWFRLSPIQELIARFFDDERSRSSAKSIERVTIEFAPRAVPGETLEKRDVTSTQAALLFGWMAHVLDLSTQATAWRRADEWSEVSLGSVVARFVPRARGDVPPGTVLGVALESGSARFRIEREEDPSVFRWSGEAPGGSLPTQAVRVALHGEATLLERCIERPKRNALFEASLHASARIVRPVAPRLSGAPRHAP